MQVVLMGKLGKERDWQQFKERVEECFDKEKKLGIKWKSLTLEVCYYSLKLHWVKDFLIQLNPNTFRVWYKEDRLVVRVGKTTKNKEGKVEVLKKGEYEIRREKLLNEIITSLTTRFVIILESGNKIKPIGSVFEL